MGQANYCLGIRKMEAWGGVEKERRGVLRFHNWSLLLQVIGKGKMGLGEKKKLGARIGRNKGRRELHP